MRKRIKGLGPKKEVKKGVKKLKPRTCESEALFQEQLKAGPERKWMVYPSDLLRKSTVCFCVAKDDDPRNLTYFCLS